MTLTREEIVKALRNLEWIGSGAKYAVNQAADLIEALTAELAEKDNVIAELKQSAQNWHEGHEAEKGGEDR